MERCPYSKAGILKLNMPKNMATSLTWQRIERTCETVLHV
jgi:hypothetical protein